MHLNTSVKTVDHSVCTLGDGRTLPFGLMVWSTGLAPIDLVRDMQGVKKERGRIAIDGRLRVPGMEGVFAMGDAAVDPENPLGPLAQVADQQGKVREHVFYVLLRCICDNMHSMRTRVTLYYVLSYYTTTFFL